MSTKNLLDIKSKYKDSLGGPQANTPCFQWRGLDLIPGQGTRSHMMQLKIPHAATKKKKIPNTAPKTWLGQIRKY